MIGWRAAKANLRPGLVVQGVMLAILVAYFLHPPTKAVLEQLAEVKARWGYGFSALAGIVAGALIPELLRIVVFQRRRVKRGNATNLLFTVPFWCTMALVVDCFYRLQAHWFGDEASLSSVLPQVLVDQFLYNPLVAQPLTVWCYDWFKSGCRMPRGAFTANYYRRHILPALIANWGVWIPVVTILYTLPEPVQIPLFALALTLWVMIYTWMSEQREG